MSKLRLDYFLMRGGKLVDGDVCIGADGYEKVLELDVVDWNIVEDINSKCFIKSFTQRENTGEQPVPDDFPVVVWLRNDDKHWIPADDFIWSVTGEDDDITLWKPAIEKLIEQQKQYDKGQSIYNLKTSPKESPVVYTQEMKDKRVLPSIGMKCTVVKTWLFVGVSSNGSWVMEDETDGTLQRFKPEQVKPYITLEQLLKETQRNKAAQILCDAYCELVNDYSKTKEHFLTEAKALQDSGMLKDITL